MTREDLASAAAEQLISTMRENGEDLSELNIDDFADELDELSMEVQKHIQQQLTIIQFVSNVE